MPMVTHKMPVSLREEYLAGVERGESVWSHSVGERDAYRWVDRFGQTWEVVWDHVSGSIVQTTVLS